MALLKDFVVDEGTTLTGAYHRIAHLDPNDPMNATMTVLTYASEARRRAGGNVFAERRYTMPDFDVAATTNDRAQAYAWLKTQLDFDEAEDG